MEDAVAHAVNISTCKFLLARISNILGGQIGYLQQVHLLKDYCHIAGM